MEDHENNQCPRRLLSCINACGRKIRNDQMAKHTSSFDGDCPERLVHCPSNLVNWRIRVPLLKALVSKDPEESRLSGLKLFEARPYLRGAFRREDENALILAGFDNHNNGNNFHHSAADKLLATARSAWGIDEEDCVGEVIKYEQYLPRDPIPAGEYLLCVSGSLTDANADDGPEEDFLLVRFRKQHAWIHVWSVPFTFISKGGKNDDTVDVKKKVLDNKSSSSSGGNDGRVLKDYPGKVTVVGNEKVRYMSSVERSNLFECGWVTLSDLHYHLKTECKFRPVWLGTATDVPASVAVREGEPDDEVSEML